MNEFIFIIFLKIINESFIQFLCKNHVLKKLLLFFIIIFCYNIIFNIYKLFSFVSLFFIF